LLGRAGGDWSFENVYKSQSRTPPPWMLMTTRGAGFGSDIGLSGD